MNNPFDFFDKIFIINLDYRKDRLEKCISEFSKYEINSKITRFPAIQLKYEDGSSDKFLGRCGCALSHFEICKIAKKENLKNYLVLEDDLEFNLDKNSLFDNLDKSIKELPEDWDILYLGGNLTNEYGIYPIEKYSKNLLKLNSCHTTHAMAFNSNFYDSFLNEAPDIHSIIDWSIKNEVIDVFLSKKVLSKNNCFITNELLILQSEGFSDIEKSFYDYRSWIASNFEFFKKQI
jgi:GR25 family glycosyltransferase involved in LPS biosynthesis